MFNGAAFNMTRIKNVILHNIIAPYRIWLFNALHKQMNDFIVMYNAKTNCEREWVIDENEQKFPYEIAFNTLENNIPAISLFKRTWQRLNHFDPEVVILGGYSISNYWAGFLWARLNGRKLILWSCSNKNDHSRFFLKEAVKRFMVKRCDAYNVYGSKSREYLMELGADENRISIVGNNTDNQFYKNAVSKYRSRREQLLEQFHLRKKNFLFIGRFSPEKNLFFLLDAYKRIAHKYPGWGLILVGNGPQFGEVGKYVNGNKLINVFMPGFIQKNELPKFFAMSDILILPSISEPWGLVVNEAMASGLPILVSKKCGCYPDLVKDGKNGFSFDPYDREDLCILMEKIASGEVNLQNMGERALNMINEYTLGNAARIIKETIELVMTLGLNKNRK